MVRYNLQLEGAETLIAASDAPQSWKDAADVVCDGTDDQIKVNNALVSNARVRMSPGTFYGNMATVSSYTRAMLRVPSGRQLRGSGMDVTSWLLGPNQAAPTQPPTTGGHAVMVLNADVDLGNEDIYLADFTLDGNAANQLTGGHDIQNGVQFRDVQRALVERVRVVNVRGTGSSTNESQAENFLCDSVYGRWIDWVDCEVMRTAGSVATGFSSNRSHNITWTRCRAIGLNIGHGFTAWASSNLTRTDCWAGNNERRGFNDEYNFGIRNIGCIAGGRTNHLSSARVFFGSQQSYPNGNYGFQALSCQDYELIGCEASYNGTGTDTGTGTGGVLIANHDNQTYAPPAAGRRWSIVGGTYHHNTGYGVGAWLGAAAHLGYISPQTHIADNTIAQIQGVGAAGTGSIALPGAAGFVPNTPTLPTSGTGRRNHLPFPVVVYIAGGSEVTVEVGPSSYTEPVYQAVGEMRTVHLGPGQWVKPTYSSAPAWRWFKA